MTEQRASSPAENADANDLESVPESVPGSGGRLVFADDGSQTSDLVWHWIEQHQWADWTISVVNADDAPDVTILPPDRVPLVPWESPHPRVLENDSGGQTRVEHLVGRADPRVVNDSSGPSSLMVVGPRRSGLFKRLGLGSTVEWLVGSPEPPVAIIRHSEPTTRIMIYIDGSADAQRGVECVAELPWLSAAEVTLLTPGGDGRYSEGVEAAVARLRASAVEPVIDSVHAPARLGGADLARAVVTAIRASEPQLLVLGVSAFDALGRAFRSSGATESTQSVLVAQAPLAPKAVGKAAKAPQPPRESTEPQAPKAN